MIRRLSALFILAYAVSPVTVIADDAAIEAWELRYCEIAAGLTLLAPSTYRRIDAFNNGPEWFIEFDSQNQYGVPIRSIAQCRFRRSIREGVDPVLLFMAIDGKEQDVNSIWPWVNRKLEQH